MNTSLKNLYYKINTLQAEKEKLTEEVMVYRNQAKEENEDRKLFAKMLYDADLMHKEEVSDLKKEISDLHSRLLDTELEAMNYKKAYDKLYGIDKLDQQMAEMEARCNSAEAYAKDLGI